MIIGHEFDEKNNIVILHFDFSLEIGNMGNKNKTNLVSTVKNYLRNINLKNNYKKIVLMVGSIVVGTLLYINGNVISYPSLETNFNVSLLLPPIETFGYKEIEIPEIAYNNEQYSSDNLIIANPKLEEVQKKDEVVQNNSNVKKENNKEQNIDKNSKPTKKEENKVVESITKPAESNVKQEKPQIAVEKEENIKQEKMVIIYRNNGQILRLELEEYIVGVVAAEMPASFSIEALKSQAVVARTYALKKMSNGEKLTDTVATQAYIDMEQMKTKWGADYNKYYNKIKDAVSKTEGEYITYKGNYINAVYHSTSNGYTEDAVNVWKESFPYLKSVNSSWDRNVSSYEKTINKDFKNLLEITGLNDISEIKVLSRNSSGRVETIQVGKKTYTGVEFRNLLGLRSADFDIKITSDKIEITTRGYGHGVGMSQYGANEMAKQGYNYKQIINHYYTGVQIVK